MCVGGSTVSQNWQMDKKWPYLVTSRSALPHSSSSCSTSWSMRQKHLLEIIRNEPTTLYYVLKKVGWKTERASETARCAHRTAKEQGGGRYTETHQPTFSLPISSYKSQSFSNFANSVGANDFLLLRAALASVPAYFCSALSTMGWNFANVKTP